jgi:hypothetical protein
MALIQCSDCGKEVSASAPQCIHCGRPMAQRTSKEKTSTSACSCSGCLVVAVGLFIILSLLGSGSRQTPISSSNRKGNSQEYKTGTINGYDKTTNSIIDPINVFEKSGALSGKTKDGERVTILEKDSDGWLRIKTASGVTGWISPRFVRQD